MTEETTTGTPAPPFYEHQLMTGNIVRIYAISTTAGTRLTAKLFCGEHVTPFEPLTFGTAMATSEVERRNFFHTMVERAVKGVDVVATHVGHKNGMQAASPPLAPVTRLVE